MLPRIARIASVVGFASLLAPAAEASWQELHETSDDVRIAVEPDGNATIEHHLRYRVVAGHFKTIDLTGIDLRAQLSPEVTLTAEKSGAELVARIEPVAKSPGTLRIAIDEGKGLGRGTYLGVVRYRMDLVAAKMLSRDGAMWKLTWTAPATPEGHDGARVVVDVPSAPTEPRLAGATESTTTLATLRRTTERDELELVRAHVPRGEAVVWQARIDPRALPRVTAPDLRPLPVPEVAPTLIGSNLGRVLVACGFAILAAGMALLLREKQRAVRAAAEARGLEARPLVGLPGTAYAFGIAIASALAVLLWSHPVVGATLVALAMALAVHRAPVALARSRVPGAWKAACDPAVLLAPKAEPLPTDRLDVGTWTGKAILFGVLLVTFGLAFGLRALVPQIVIALPLTVVACLPIFATGTRAQMPKTPVEVAMHVLRPARDAIAAKLDLSHVEMQSIVRVPEGEPSIDEVRLSCVPRERTPGLQAIELAVAGQITPEIIVRYDGDSQAADRVVQLAPGGSLGPGHTPAERTLRLAPKEPTAESSAELVARLLLGLEERRRKATSARSAASKAGFRGRDRRRPQGLFMVERPS